jgi:ABC-type spermidine/putrescine transport system permease subunit I
MAKRGLSHREVTTPDATGTRVLIRDRKPRNWELLLLLGPPLVFLLVFFLYPLGRVVYGSFFSPQFNVAAYQRIFRAALYLKVFSITLRVSLLTTLSCAVLGYVCAYFLAGTAPATRQKLMLCVIIPFFLSMLVRNYIWMAILQRTGLINKLLMRLQIIDHPLELMYNEFGVLVVMTNMLLPYMILPILASLLSISGDLANASASLGASPLRTFWRVTFPLSLPGVSAGSLLVFIVSLGFFITPALVGGPKQTMISNLIDFNVREVLNWPFAYALATTLLVGTLILYFIYIRVLEGRLPRMGFS